MAYNEVYSSLPEQPKRMEGVTSAFLGTLWTTTNIMSIHNARDTMSTDPLLRRFRCHDEFSGILWIRRSRGGKNPPCGGGDAT